MNGPSNGQAIELAVAKALKRPRLVDDEIEVVALARSVSRGDVIIAADDLLMVAISDAATLWVLSSTLLT